jgi:hypothetical protein
VSLYLEWCGVVRCFAQLLGRDRAYDDDMTSLQSTFHVPALPPFSLPYLASSTPYRHTIPLLDLLCAFISMMIILNRFTANSRHFYLSDTSSRGHIHSFSSVRMKMLERGRSVSIRKMQFKINFRLICWL